jgi:hypothetical protein
MPRPGSQRFSCSIQDNIARPSRGFVNAPRPKVCSSRVNPHLPTKSPVFSPDLEKGRGSLDFPLIVRDTPDEIPLSALASKPSLRPESRDSPRNHARHQMVLRGGGVLATQPRDAKAVSSDAGESEINNRNPVPETRNRTLLQPGSQTRFRDHNSGTNGFLETALLDNNNFLNHNFETV